jgi:tetratricopeptide (TPR) repeat protein
VQIKTPVSGSSQMANGAPQPFMDGSPQTPWSGAETAYAPPKKRAWPIAIILSLLIIAAGAVAIYMLMVKKASPKESILQEIRRGNLVKPEGSSAYDLYQKNVGTLSAQDKTEITNLAASQLEKRGTDIIARLKMEEDVSEADWAESVRVYSWLNELKPGSTNEARKFFSSGRLAFDKKDFNKAREELDRSIQAEPKWAMSLNAMGRVYVQLQKTTGDNSYFSRADDYYGRAVEAEPTWVLPLINRASLRYQMKDYFNASTFIRQAIAMEPNRPNSHKLYGDILLRQDQPCPAKAEYQIALDNVPANSYPTWLEPVRQEVTRINNRYRCSEMGL